MLAGLPLLFGLLVHSGAPPVAPASRAVKRSLASSTWPVAPSLNAGFLASDLDLLPFIGVSVFVPVWPGLGPSLIVRASGTQVGELLFYEGFVGIGAAWEAHLQDVHVRATLTPAVLASGFRFDEGDSGLSFGPGLLLPLELSLPLGNGVAFTGSVEPGLGRTVIHAVDGSYAVGRNRLFVFLGAGLSFGGPPAE